MQRTRTPGAGVTGAQMSFGGDRAHPAEADPPHQSRRGARIPDTWRGRVATVRNLAANLTRRNGVAPTDAELAWWLACPIETIRRSKAWLSGGRGDE